MTQTPAERKSAERARYKKAGLVAVTVHVHPDNREKLYRYAKWLNDKSKMAHVKSIDNKPRD